MAVQHDYDASFSDRVNNNRSFNDVISNAVKNVTQRAKQETQQNWKGIQENKFNRWMQGTGIASPTPKAQDNLQFSGNTPEKQESDNSLSWGENFFDNNLAMNNGFLNPSYVEAAQKWGYQPEENEKSDDNANRMNDEANWQMSYLLEHGYNPQFLANQLITNPEAMALDESGYLPIIGKDDHGKNMYESWVAPKKAKREEAEAAEAAADPNNLAKTNERYRNQFGGQWMTDMSGNERTEDLFQVDPNTGKFQHWNYLLNDWQDAPEGLWNPKTGELNLTVGGRQARTMDDVEQAMYMLLYGPGGEYGDDWGRLQFDTSNPNYDKFWEFTMSDASPVGEHYKWLRDADIWGDDGYSYNAYQDWIGADPIDLASVDPLRYLALEGTSALGMASTNDYLSNAQMRPFYLDVTNITPEQMAALGYTQDMIDAEADALGRIPLNIPGSDGVTNMLSVYKYLGDDNLREITGDTPFSAAEMNQLLGIYGDDDELKYTDTPNPEDYDIEGARERWYDPFSRIIDPSQIDYETLLYSDVPVEDILALLEGDLSNYGIGLHRASEYA